ncbi:MAG TPA: c-type cytochrome domain-containing protein [Rhodothermia bacterium]
MFKNVALIACIIPVVFGGRLGLYGQAMDSLSSSKTYSTEIQPILDQRCTACHAGENPAKLLRLDSWDHLMAGGRHGEAVIPFDSKNSLLIELVTRANAPAHPAEEGADTLTAAEIQAISQWIDAGARSDSGEAPFAHSDEVIYVCNEGAAMVSVIDVKAGVVARTVNLQKLGFSLQASPHHAAIEPDGSHWYVSLIGENKVLKFDRENNLVAQVDFERPGLLALDPNSDKLYVGRSMKAVNPPQRIGIITRSTMEIEEVDVFIARPHALILSHDGNYVYSSSMAANQVVTMDTRSLESDLLNIPGPVHSLVQFAISPDGLTMAAGGHVSSKFLFFDLTDPAKPELTDSLSVDAIPWDPVYSKDGKLLYFPSKGANSVTVLNALDHSLAAVIKGRGIAQPHASALSMDGRLLFVSSNNMDGSYTPRYDLGDNSRVGTVAIIDTESRRILKVIEVEENATGIGAR